MTKTTWKPHEKHGELSTADRDKLPDSVYAGPVRPGQGSRRRRTRPGVRQHPRRREALRGRRRRRRLAPARQAAAHAHPGALTAHVVVGWGDGGSGGRPHRYPDGPQSSSVTGWLVATSSSTRSPTGSASSMSSVLGF